jgi:hypothetical protein
VHFITLNSTTQMGCMMKIKIKARNSGKITLWWTLHGLTSYSGKAFVFDCNEEEHRRILSTGFHIHSGEYRIKVQSEKP